LFPLSSRNKAVDSSLLIWFMIHESWTMTSNLFLPFFVILQDSNCYLKQDMIDCYKLLFNLALDKAQASQLKWYTVPPVCFFFSIFFFWKEKKKWYNLKVDLKYLFLFLLRSTYFRVFCATDHWWGCITLAICQTNSKVKIAFVEKMCHVPCAYIHQDQNLLQRQIQIGPECF